VTPESLAAKRAYVVVGCFILGMLLTPPDVISQVLLALPMWILYELGIIIGRRITPKKKKDDNDGEEDDDL
jgi:sec-independent protein translocase protein TatC